MFKKNDIINDKFEVLFPIQSTTFGSSYRVKGKEDGKIYMLKIYEKEKLHDWHFNEKGGLIGAFGNFSSNPLRYFSDCSVTPSNE